MAERSWYSDGTLPKGDLVERGVFQSDVRVYREIAQLREAQGTDDALTTAIELIEMADAVEQWFENSPSEPYGVAPLLVTYAEGGLLADAYHDWTAIAGNCERQEADWHDEYVERMGSALLALGEAGFAADGMASRHEMVFKMIATHPEIAAEIDAYDAVLDTLYRDKDLRYGFNYDRTHEGLFVATYDSCPPSGNFEPVIASLVEITQAF